MGRTPGRDFPNLGLKFEAPRLGYALGQNIYTPNNLRASGMITYDRPYAGYIYFGALLQRRGRSFGHIPTLDTFASISLNAKF